ncbi:MAG: acetyl-CoA carboxylase biotin carboxylase subunit [Proteobacteria bacterium]|nr:acetyl-CoA carboxylase biotin carboxylase subunit [Pseudomonadota bacterium]MBU1585689.1 acetyl-CoA carboxylase biotin carboxylase subunit [Pseudomonadota bacterium]MBU2631207.1 acetyl-CoA carboxylase biotin carboxylase subunit [Pseudomonadota bacterium]
MFKRILIANRGEIAVRVIRACREMGIATVAVYSDADKDSLHVKYADDAVNIGPALSHKSYLNMDNIIDAAKKTKADAIHPGYGFLSENAAFAQACQDNDITFIGPTAHCIAKAGDKSSARKALIDIGIPVIPGSDDILLSSDMACVAADSVGFPVILKASGGGGGRGMRIARTKKELIDAFSMASGEAAAAFGNPDIYLEKYIEKPRHIEIQILGDMFGNFVHLAERECSIQMRYQKLIEEAPSSFVDEELRATLGETAITIARAIGYHNAGTIEFLLDKDKNFYFMEVNARVQVEHPVTELITGIDIVRQQILISAGQKLTIRQDEIIPNGWSIECRINASDPDDDFMPSPGRIESILFPGGPGVRIDTHIHDNYMVGPFYDALIGKLIVWDKDRPMAISRMKRALDEFEIKGIQTTIPFFRKIFRNKDFQKGDIDTHFLENISSAKVNT